MQSMEVDDQHALDPQQHHCNRGNGQKIEDNLHRPYGRVIVMNTWMNWSIVQGIFKYLSKTSFYEAGRDALPKSLTLRFGSLFDPEHAFAHHDTTVLITSYFRLSYIIIYLHVSLFCGVLFPWQLRPHYLHVCRTTRAFGCEKQSVGLEV